MIITTTYPNLQNAKKLAKILLTKKLAACIQFSKIESCYLWNKKITNDKEILVSIKTTSNFFEKISKIITENHQYEVPEIIGINIDKGSNSYLNWIASNLEIQK